MNKVLKFALGAVLSATLVAPAFAQDNFPDVPENHWAYTALSNLKDKVVFGYPDGFYRGPRMMSRYEFAVAINQLWMRMSGMFDDVNSKIDALSAKVDGMGGGDDNGDLKSQLAALKNQVNGMAGWEKSITDLQKLTAEFEKELAALGVDVDALKRDVSDLKARVEALEKKKNAITIGANVDMLVLAGHSSDNRTGLLQDGTIVGTDTFGLPAGMQDDLRVLHDVALKLSGATDNGVEWKATLGVGNSYGTIGGFNTAGAGNRFGNVANTEIVFNEMYVKYNSSLVGQGVGVTVGRFGKQVGKYIWERPAYSADYYANDLRDSGDWYMDGMELGFNFGKAALKVFGGRNSNLLTTNGTEINGSAFPGVFAAPLVDTTLGVSLDVPVGDQGDITLAYLWQDTFANDSLPPAINRRNTFGADANLMFSNIKFHGSFAQTDLGYNTNTVSNNNNTAYDLGVGFMAGGVDIMGGYRRVEQNFAADGAWGRLGTVWNPTNIEGFNVGLKFNPSADFSLYGKGEFVEAINAGAGNWGAASSSDKITSYTIGAGYKLSNSFDLGLKYENVKFDYNAGTDPDLRWYSVMLGYNLAENAKLSFTYTYSDVDFKGRQGTFGFGNARYTGGLLGTQLSVKF